MPLGILWRELVYEALVRVGGSGTLSEIYNAVEGMFLEANDPGPTASWQAIVRRELEWNSSDSESFQHRADLFTSTRGIGAGHWSLRNNPVVLDHVEDVNLNDEARRAGSHVERIIRDGVTVRALKALHDNTCQLCGTRMQFPDGRTYSEVHHLKPLGRPHNGPDKKANMIVVCPNCHVLLDYGARSVEPDEVAASSHPIGAEFVAYNNSLTRWRVDPLE